MRAPTELVAKNCGCGDCQNLPAFPTIKVQSAGDGAENLVLNEAERRANVTEQEKEAILRASQDRERYWEERLQTACSEREREALRINEVALTSLLLVSLQSTLRQNSVDILCWHLVSSRNGGKRKLTTVLSLRMCRYLWRKGRIERGSATKR